MAIRWDPLLAAAVSRELDALLQGSRVRALLLDSETRRLLVFFLEHTLVLELHPLQGWLSLLPAQEPPSEARPYAYTMAGVRAPPDESAIVLELRPLRRSEPIEIVVELIGNRWNTLVVEQRGKIIRHVLASRRDRVRNLTVGSEYRPPTRTPRMGVGSPLDEQLWTEVLEAAGDDVGARRGAILRRIGWTSSLNVDSLVGSDGWLRWKQMIDPAGWSGFVSKTSRGDQPYPVCVEPGATQSTSLLDAFRMARERDPVAQPVSSLLVPPGLIAELRRRLDIATRKVDGLNRQLTHGGEPETVRRIGDLILARLAEIPRGVEGTTLVDFEGGEREVTLDPALSPSENAARYYKEAARLERARSALPGRIRDAQEGVRRWADRLAEALSGEVQSGDLALALGPARSVPTKTNPTVDALPYRKFLSSGGLEIRVGRGASRNDDLTFHHSAPNDVWMHVRQAPGAHVILRWNGTGNPPRQDLAEAAALAALHSPARHAGSVAVGWTRRKYVQKPRGAPPGTVLPDRTKTVFVTPEPDLIERLAVRD